MRRCLFWGCVLWAGFAARAQTPAGHGGAADAGEAGAARSSLESERGSVPPRSDESADAAEDTDDSPPEATPGSASAVLLPTQLWQRTDAIEARLKLIREKIRRNLATRTDARGRRTYARAWSDMVNICKRNRGVKATGLRGPAGDKANAAARLDLTTFGAIMGAVRGLSKKSETDLGGFSEADLFALTVTAFGEARSLADANTWYDLRGRANMMLVMNTINDRRIKKYKNLGTAADQALLEAQYSCWYRVDPNFACMVAGPMGELPRDLEAHRRTAAAFADLINPQTRVFFGNRKPPAQRAVLGLGTQGIPENVQLFLNYVTDKLYLSKQGWWKEMQIVPRVGAVLQDLNNGLWQPVPAAKDKALIRQAAPKKATSHWFLI